MCMHSYAHWDYRLSWLNRCQHSSYYLLCAWQYSEENKLWASRANTWLLFSCYLRNKEDLRFFSSAASNETCFCLCHLSTAAGCPPMPKALQAQKWGWTVEPEACPSTSFSITWRQALAAAWNILYTGETHTLYEIAFPEVVALSLEEKEWAWMRHQETTCEVMKCYKHPYKWLLVKKLFCFSNMKSFHVTSY